MSESARGSTPEEAPVRGPAERQLNAGLMVVMAVAALIVAYAVLYVVLAWDGDGERTRFASIQVAVVFLLLPGLVVFFVARSARRRLAVQAISARLWGILTGVFALLAGLPLLTTVFGLASVAAGLFTLTAALLLKRAVPR
jgi:lysylphosphatidylglycerol synthetase-like protein (DUF2156 family)